MQKDEEATFHKVKKNSLILMVFTFLSRILGICRARVIATYFGASGVGDVINFTFNIPNNFRKLFAEGAFNSAFIPVFTRLIVTPTRQKELLRTLYGFQAAIIAPIILIAFIYRVQIITLFSDFSDPSLILLASHFLPLFMIYLAFIMVYALLIGVLQSHNLFITAAVAPLIFSITVIFSIILLNEYIGPYSFVVGVLIGGFLQSFFTFIRVKKLHYDAHLSFNFKNSDFIDVMKRWGPVTISAVITIIGQQIAYYAASTLDSGSVTYLSNAIIVWQAPYGIFLGAIATSFFPSLVLAGSNNNRDFLKRLSSHALINITALLFPAVLLLTLLGDQTTVVLLTSGKYTLQDALHTSDVLFFYAFAMLIAAWYTFFQRIAYSIDDFNVSLVITSVVSIVDIIFILLLLRVRPLVSSISMASIISFSIGLSMYLIYIGKRGLLGIFHAKFFTNIGKILVSNIPLWFFLYGSSKWATPLFFSELSTLSSFVLLSLIYSGAIVITFLTYRIFHIDVMSVFKKNERVIK